MSIALCVDPARAGMILRAGAQTIGSWSVDPARAGMIPTHDLRRGLEKGVPRASGDNLD